MFTEAVHMENYARNIRMLLFLTLERSFIGLLLKFLISEMHFVRYFY